MKPDQDFETLYKSAQFALRLNTVILAVTTTALVLTLAVTIPRIRSVNKILESQIRELVKERDVETARANAADAFALRTITAAENATESYRTNLIELCRRFGLGDTQPVKELERLAPKTNWTSNAVYTNRSAEFRTNK